MTQRSATGFQDGFIEIVKEQIGALQQEVKEHDSEIERLEHTLDATRQTRFETARQIDQLQHLLSANQPNGSGSAEQGVLRPFADADAVVNLIRDHGAPMHYRKIHEVLVQRGFKIGGKGEATTLLSRYFRDPRLVRVSRGTYDLAREGSTGEAGALNDQDGVKAPDFSLDSTNTPNGVRLMEKIALVLRHAGEPLHYREITERLLRSGTWETSGRTPEATVNSRIVVDINGLGSQSTFVRTVPGVYGLREWDLVSD